MKNKLSIVLILVLITGCQKSYDNGLVKYDPPVLNTCESHEVTVKWDMSKKEPVVGAVYVYVVGSDSKEHLFSEGGGCWGG